MDYKKLSDAKNLNLLRLKNQILMICILYDATN